MKRARKWRRAMERAMPWLALVAVSLCARAIVSHWDSSEDARPAAAAVAPSRAQGPAPARRTKAAVAKSTVAAAARSQPAASEPPPSEPPAFVDLFPRQDWAPPPPPPPPVSDAPPPPAQPPPLPFSIGALWLDGNGAFYAVLNAQGREFPLCAACRQSGFYREGDVLLGAYRIEKLTSREVRFLYLPMKRRQQMSLGG